jgi:hypothetical protein
MAGRKDWNVNENMKSVSRLAKLAKGARTLGLWMLGWSAYVGLLVFIGVVLWKGAVTGKISTGDAMYLGMTATTVLHWMLFAFSA